VTLHAIAHFVAYERDSLPRALGEQPLIHPPALVIDSQIGSYAEVGADSQIIESILDDYTYTAGDNQIIYSTIGKFTSIASHVRVNPGNHPMERVTQHHMTYRRAQYGFGEDDADFFAWRRAHHCTVGHDVWIGHGAIIMPGVHVGTGAVVGAGAVVTKDVAPYLIVGGVPARPIRMRFSEAIASSLLAIAWWDWDHAALKARFDDLLDVAGFVAKYG